MQSISGTRSLYMLSFLLFSFTSCVKDRVNKTDIVNPGSPVDPGDRNLIHYWDFNTGDLMTPAFSETGGSIATSNTYDDTDGSELNLRNSSAAGKALRMRNPSTFMVVKSPTTGYKAPLLTFSVMRTNNGPKENIIEYTIDGIHFTSDGMASNKVNVSEEWTAYSIDFSGLTGVEDNPLFAIRFTFSIGNTNPSGNDRYDNISIDALPR